MATEKRLIDLEKARNNVLEILAGKVTTITAVRISAAMEAETVDAVEVVHGHWINWGKSGTPTYENYGTCSVCHEDAEICTEHRNYCPNCGAQMDLEVPDGQT